MTIQEFELHLISDNPWQTRPLDEAHAAALAGDIAEHGLLQAPVGRVHPDRPEYIQLATGHHRLAAIRLLRQKVYANQGPNTGDRTWSAVGVDVRELSDLQMAQVAIAENHARKDLTALEKAQALKRLIDEFGLTQAKAGEAFTLTQSGVANLLRLLKLPEPIQAHVQSGLLPERLARELVTISKIYPAEAIKIANEAAKAEPETRDGIFDEAREELYRAKGAGMWGMPWKMDWPTEPIKVEGHKSISQIPACTGCEFFRKPPFNGAAGTCLRKECFEQKKIEHAWLQVPAGAKKAGVPAGTRGAAVVDLIPTGFDSKYLDRVLRSKHASLVVVPATGKGNWQNSQQRKDITGSEHLTVATTDVKALELAVPKPKEQPAPRPRPAYDFKAEQAKRQAKEHEIAELFARVAPLLARSIPWSDPVTLFLWELVDDQFGDTGAWKHARTPAERAALLSKALLFERLEHNVYGEDSFSTKRAHDIVLIVAQAFGAKLPNDWEQVAPLAPAPKPVAKAKKPSKAAAAATAAAQALVAKAGNVHGHTHPAPKPSAKKTTRRKTAQKGK